MLPQANRTPRGLPRQSCHYMCCSLEEPKANNKNKKSTTMSRKILVVDDDRKTVDLLRLYLEKDGYQVLAAHDGRQALDLTRQRRPDLIVLDLMLPSVDGLDVCRILRAESATPIIMLTARTTEDDKLLGLDLGADDYITKPFSPREVVARVRVVLRRSGEEREREPQRMRIRELVVDFIS